MTKIKHDDEKAIEMVVELLVSRYVNSLKAIDIEDVLEMEFDNYERAMTTFEGVVQEFKNKKGL